METQSTIILTTRGCTVCSFKDRTSRRCRSRSGWFGKCRLSPRKPSDCQLAVSLSISSHQAFPWGCIDFILVYRLCGVGLLLALCLLYSIVSAWAPWFLNACRVASLQTWTRNRGAVNCYVSFQLSGDLKFPVAISVMIHPTIGDGAKRPLNRAIIHGPLPGGILPVIARCNTTLGWVILRTFLMGAYNAVDVRETGNTTVFHQHCK